jgi:hypothetical protein
LARHIRWSETHVICTNLPMPDTDDALSLPPLSEVIASPTVHPDLLARFRRGDVQGPAADYIARVVNERLAGAVVPRLVVDHDRGPPTLQLMPTTLRSALWLQFGQAVSDNKDYRRCAVCEKYFEVSPPVVRKSRQFCSDACRFKAYRGRQARARQLHVGGKGFKQIAKELNSEPQTVRKWVSGQEGQQERGPRRPPGR